MANRLLRSLTGTIQREMARIVHRRAPFSGSSRPAAQARGALGQASPPLADGYPGDFHGEVDIRYAPHPDGEPDPGEIVWAWVPYEEDHTQGKDRPVLLVGHDGPWLLALQMTSRDHDRDPKRERRAGRVWVDIGSGAWDQQRRPSEVRVSRILRIDPRGVRREGAVLAREIFDEVADAVRTHS
ncbi:MAG: type II toxin-antitoxin system PemK/MazF family toxin [Dermatophilaceae bacterium]|nr:type II toxin-antitoxin system PemK/MazF family toxin [Intrasporangiaceae bacterium]